MEQQELQQIKNWYAKSTSPILLFSQDFARIWQNMPCPMLDAVEDIPAFFGFSRAFVPTAPMLFRFQQWLYQIQFQQHDLTDTQCYTAQVVPLSHQELAWQNEAWRHREETEAASIRQEVFGISNAVSALYNAIEETTDTASNSLWDEQMQQLNIIKGNCCRLMLSSVFFSEMNKYYSKTEITLESVQLEETLLRFRQACHGILGNFHRITVQSPPELLIACNSERLYFALFCLLRRIKSGCPHLTEFSLEAVQHDQEAVLTITASDNGTEPSRSRHADLEMPYTPLLATPEENILRLFCSTYSVVQLERASADQAVYALRFPLCQKALPLPQNFRHKDPLDDAFSIEHVLLSQIADYRFY